MIEWASYAREQIKTIREEKWLENKSKLNHDASMTQVWRQVNRVRGKHTKPLRHPDPAGKASELMREYRERAASDSLPENVKEAKNNLDPARKAGVAAARSPREIGREILGVQYKLGHRAIGPRWDVHRGS
ncbi:hypothetical protein O3P69_004030 [Scylla paramamosain]|uniref:Uncharacterized protein n=1 Tax=Scylla paramamosain TaxID=85552 RepID=A0AAW0UIF7_SCYPA